MTIPKHRRLEEKIIRRVDNEARKNKTASERVAESIKEYVDSTGS